jgi:glycosyltransferase involved in cell wall biosynthesis
MVSIICNAYNHEKYIKDALDGFVMQETSFPYEVLIHDDASIDGTAEIIREYERKYPAIIKPIYQKENQYSKGLGLVGKIQKERAIRKYVAMCEGDDYWTDPYKLQKQFDFMENNPDYTLCGCTTDWLNMLTGKVGKGMRTEVDRDVSLEEFVLAPNGRPFPFVSFFVRTEIWKDMPSWGFPVGDLPLTYYAAMMGKVRMLAYCMCVYRWNAEGSWTVRKGGNENRARICEKMITGYDRIKEFSGGQYKELFEKRKLYFCYSDALYKENFKSIIRDPELYEYFKKRSFTMKVSDVVRCIAPGLFLKFQKLKGRR